MNKWDGFFIGQIARTKRTFTENDIKRCMLLTLDNNEVYQADFSHESLENPIMPGILSEGLLNELFSHKLPGLPSVIVQKELVYMHSVHLGDSITAEAEIIEINKHRHWITQKVRCINECGSEVIRGRVILKLL